MLMFISFSVSLKAASEQLPRFGVLPDLGRDWKFRESGTNGTASNGFSWMVFTNTQTGDLMSFAACKYGDGIFPKVSRDSWSSSAGEIFPDGYPVWAKNHPEVMVNCIRNDLVELVGHDHAQGKNLPKEALRYSIIFEHVLKPVTNRLAHGYALALGEFAIFVQHTSTRPITADDAEGFATQLISAYSAQAADQKSKHLFSGSSLVPGLGQVFFPPGKWTMEFRRLQPATNTWRPDYFVFTNESEPVHRLAFLKYPPRVAGRQLWSRIDGLHESMGEGVPPQERTGDESYSITMMGNDLVSLPPDPTNISWSFISTRKGLSWLCHATLLNHDGSDFAVLYTSREVTLPSLRDDPVSKSGFLKRRR
jgi:hypothetical protein